jgi:hypothetical protein
VKLSRHSIAILIICCALIPGCTQETKRPGPKFTGRLLLLNRGDANGSDLVELTQAPASSTYNLSTIVSGVIDATPNPDQTQLLYSTKDEVMLRDLKGGAVKSLIKGENSCLAWGPDGKHFSFKQQQGSTTSTKVYVSDLDGKTKLIWEDKMPANSYCPHWILPDRLVLDRFVGAMTKQAGSEQIKPNTMTLATLGDPVKFVDADRKWSIQGACPSGSVILTPADQAQPTFIATKFDQFQKLNPTPGPSEGRFVGFAAKSCVPFFVQQSSSTTTDVFSLNPTNWQRQRAASIEQTFSPSAKMLIKSSARLMIVGDAPALLLLVDTESGDATSFFPKPEGGAAASPLKSPVPVVWIEN